MQMRTRECVNPKPQFGGIPCKGSTTVMRGCTNTSSCQQEFPVRFQTEGNPSTGLMQIHKNNTWKALCTAHWNNSERILACHVNGYSDYNNDNFTGNWKRGNTSLMNITSHSCSSITQSCGLINNQTECPVPVRLIGAKVVYGGRVEVFYRRRWGKICRNKWDINDVKVVCKQLGFRGALAEFMTGMNTTEKNIPVVMSDIACTGQESVLAQCNRLDGEHKCPEDIGAQALCVPNNVEVLEQKSLSSNLGSTDTVKCSLKKENEREMVKWYEIGTTVRELKSEGRIEVNGVTLTIKNVQLHDGGTYECRGVGYTRFYTVYVNAQFKNKRPQQKLIYGKPGKISCTAEGNPRPQFEWSKNNTLLLEDDRFTQLSDGSLQIDTVGREDNGAYKCSIKQTKGSERITVYFQDISVSVIVPPKVKLSGTSHNVLEGDNITLTCTVVDGLPKPQISWFKDKLPLTEEKATLVKRYITEEGEGTYTCVAKNEGGSANDSINIIIDAPPKMDASLKKDSMPVLLHSTLQLKCIERGDPEPNVTWTNNGTQLSNNNTFVITNVTFKDAGQYGCVAMNRAGNISGNIWIDVVVYPVVDVYPRNQTVPEGKTTNISCKAKGEPLPKLSWKFDEGELPPAAVIMNTSDGSLLQLPTITKRMEGRYKCKATNKAGEEHSTSTLHVLEKPTVVISGESYQRKLEGDRLNLICLASVPASKIRWTIKTVSGGKMAYITKNGNRSLLIIESVKVSDSGEYICKAKNAAGTASSSVDVEVRALQVHVQAAIEWYYIVGPVSAVAVTAFIAWYLCKRRTRDIGVRSTDFEESHEMKLMDVEVDEWEISRDRIRLEEVIGSGAFGTVWRATLSRKNGKPGIRFVAAKCFTPTSGEEGRKTLMREIGLGKSLADSPLPNIVEFIGCVTTQIHPILIMEYLHCGDLLGFLRKSRGIADKYYHGQGEVAQLRTYDLVSFSKQIATAMGFLASRGIIHRDLAARNVLLDKNYVCKVTDFGLSYQNFKYGHGNAKKGCVPVKWTAPEILFGDASNLSTKSDVWSYGVVLYEIFTIGGIPYPGWSEAKTIAELQKGYRMPKPPHIANTMYHFMERCWQENPDFRPNFENIRKDLLSLIEKELYLGLLDESKYDGTKYSMVEDVCAAASVQPRSKKKWSSLKY
ncbi:fibroblast growth factor receptor 1-like [Montipora capricornis]|uniref:fibroblast growth factor receptor 1-like n=1 Tax=Montipora capricornis TaxID=246305 RepID=UPI0035F209E3